MGTVTGMTAEAMAAIRDGVVIGAHISGDNLILEQFDGGTINAGSVRGAIGPPGPPAADVPVLAAQQVLDVGMANQIRAGRQLALADFTNLGLSAPAGLWNLSDLTDVSGNGRNLTNKGAVLFDTGINGVANTAAKFGGVATQALYIPDAGAGDPFRIKVGTIGAWIRPTKRGSVQSILTKIAATAGSSEVLMQMWISNTNVLQAAAYSGAGGSAAVGITDVCDDRFHFAVAVMDGTVIRLYVDGVAEAVGAMVGPIAPTAFGPLNIGGFGADAGNAAQQFFYGKVDEAFVTTDILSEDQIRNLYCAKINHGLGVLPARGSVGIRRFRRGAILAAGDFPTQPLRLHNLNDLNDLGSNAVALAANVGAGAIIQAAGPDGTKDSARFYSGAHNGDSASDAGLPTVGARSLGAWVKTGSQTNQGIIAYGTAAAESGFQVRVGTTGIMATDTWSTNRASTAPVPISDGLWHHVVAVYDPAAADGLRFKNFVDGKLVDAQIGVAITTVLAGANKLRIGTQIDGTAPMLGEIARAFICAYALTEAQIAALYAKGGQDLGRSPKNAGEHIEAMSSTSLLVCFDNIEPQNKIDLAVA